MNRKRKPKRKTVRKYRNTVVGKYQSKKEHQRAGMLKLLQRQGLIKDLKEQVRFELIPSQRGMVQGVTKGKLVMKEGVVERPVTYIADFTYTELKSGEFVVEDVKGYRTEVYNIKRKLMLYIHNIKIKET